MTSFRLLRWLPVALVVGAGLMACDKDKDVEPPAALVAFNAKVSVEHVWSASVGGKDTALRLALAPAVVDGVLYAAGADGSVQALDAVNGRQKWRVNTKLGLSGGPGAGGGLVVVGSRDGQLLALEAATGARRWLVRLSGEVMAAPVVAAESVIVRTVDGRVKALALDNGRDLWSNEEPVPRLTLRGTSRPVLAGDTVLCGFDNGKVAAYSLANGDVLWEAAVSPPHGKTELERLVDIDGSMEVSGHDVFAVGFQGRIAMLALDSGQVWWSHDASSYRGLTLAGETLYLSSADGIVSAVRRRDGTAVWTQNKLARRGLTAPAVDGGAVVVADFQGYVHWLDQGTGALIGRISTAKGRVTNAPVVANGLVYVQTDAGKLYALRARSQG